MMSVRIGIETINIVVAAFADNFHPDGPVVEIGSYYPPEYAALCDRRKFFPGQAFVGCDIREGPGVDRVEDAERLSLGDRSFQTMLLLETLEHLPHPHRALAEARRVLAENGLLLISAPFWYRLHGFPTDFWRFTPSGLHTMLDGFAGRTVLAVGPQLTPSTVFAVATPTGRTDFDQHSAALRASLPARFHAHRRRHLVKVLEERGREFMGALTGREKIRVTFYDPEQAGGYRNATGSH